MLLSASVAFAATDDNATVSDVNDEIDGTILSVEDNQVLQEDSAPAGENNAPALGSTVVTNETFHKYFDENGVILSNVTDDELIFDGDFTGIDVDNLVINKSINLIGKNATFSDVKFVIKTDHVAIEGFNLFMDNKDDALIRIFGADDVTIVNNVIDYKGLDNVDNYAIFANNVSNLNIINNRIAYVGTTTGINFNNAIRIGTDEARLKPSKGINVVGNTLNITLPSVDVYYAPYTYEPTVYSEGVVFYNCDDFLFVDNIVDLKYNNFTTAYGYDTIYVVSARGNPEDSDPDDPIVCSNYLIANNIIFGKGHEYIYGLYVSGINFTVSNNLINMVSEGYYANGINVEGPTASGLIIKNAIGVMADHVAYGVYSYGLEENLAYEENTIVTYAYASCGMEIFQKNPIIFNNTIVSDGNYTFGIVSSIGDKGTIQANNITVKGSNKGTMPTGDGLLPKDSFGISVKGEFLIKDNYVKSSGTGINLVEKGGFDIVNNTIDVEPNVLYDSYAIYAFNISNIFIAENNIRYVGNTDGTTVNNAVRIAGDEDSKTPAKNISVANNTFEIAIPSVDVYYAPVTYEPTVFSEGIVFFYCDDLAFVDNTVNLKYNNVTTAYGYDTIYVVSVRGNPYDSDPDDPIACSNYVIADNTISGEGHEYIYGVYVSGINFTVIDNFVNMTCEGYYANGINVEGPAASALFTKNIIIAKADHVAYGVYAYGQVANVAYEENSIFTHAYASCGMEIIGKNPIIFNNTIASTGNYTFGIVSSIGDKGTIQANKIASVGSNNGTIPTGDALLPKDSYGISVKGNFTIKDNYIAAFGTGINLVEKGGFDIVNNTLAITSNLYDSYAIYAFNISDIFIAENNILYYGTSQGDSVNNALCIAGDEDSETSAKNIRVVNNTFEIAIPSVDVVYDKYTSEATVYSEGIVFFYCQGLIFADNDVKLKYNNYTTKSGYDTIYVVSARGNPYNLYADDPIACSDYIIANNTISGEGHAYIYGVYVSGNKFDVLNNTIEMTSGTYSNGINVDGPASSGLVAGNLISTNASDVVYGIYSAQYMGAIKNITYADNIIGSSAYAACGMEILESNPIIIDNLIASEGNYTYGIVANSIENATISHNHIACFGSEEGNASTGDSLLPNTSLGISVKGDFVIDSNIIASSNVGAKVVGGNVSIVNNEIRTDGNYAVDLCGNDAIIDNNYIVAKTSVGPSAIINAGAGTVITNVTPYLKLILASPRVDTQYIDGTIYVVMAYDENGEPVANLTLVSMVNGKVITQTTDAGGYAAFVVDLDAGYYEALTVFSGNEVYGPKEITTPITVEPSATEISSSSSVTVLLTAVKKGTTYKITLKDMNGNGLANQKVTISFNGKTTTSKTNSLGVINYKLSATKTGTKKITIKFAGDNNYVGSSKTATIKLTKESTKLTASKKTFKAKKKTKKYTVTLKDSNKKAIKKVKVTLKIKGKTYKAKTNSKGKAVFKIKKLTKKGKYTAKVKFAGNTYYKAASKKVKITVKK